MMKELRTGIKLLKYSYGIMATLIFAFIFSLLGLMMQFTSDSQVWILGGFFFVLNAMWPIQLLFSLNASHYMQTSKYKRAFQTSTMSCINIGGIAILFLCCVIIHGVRLLLFSQMKEAVSNSIVVLAMLSVVVMIYSSLCYKFFLAACVVMYVFIFGGMNLAMRYNQGGPTAFGDLSFPLAILLSLLLLGIGGLISYGVSILVYKVPLSKMAQPATLRKYL